MCADEVQAIRLQLQWLEQQYRREVAALRHELAALRHAHDTGRDEAAGTGTSLPGPASGTSEEGGRQRTPDDGAAGLCTMSRHGYGLYAASDEGTGIYCRSFGAGDGLSALSEQGIGVAAMSLGQADGLRAQSARGNGIHAVGGAALGNGDIPRPAGLFAEGGAGYGVYAASTTGEGVAAISASGCAVDAFSVDGIAVRAHSTSLTAPALEIEGRIHIRGCAVGEVRLQEGERTRTVAAQAATDRSLVLLALLDDPGEAVRLWVSARGAGTFAISASAAPRAGIRVQYLIVN